MSVALPGAWVDTGTTASFTLSGQVALNAWSAGAGETSLQKIGMHGSNADADTWRLFVELQDNGIFPLHDYTTELHMIRVQPQLTDPQPDDLLQSIHWGPTGPPTSSFFTPVSFATTAGPYRLGVRYGRFYDPNQGGPQEQPDRIDDYQLEFAWFADEFTTWNETVAGVNRVLYVLNDALAPPPAGSTPVEQTGWIDQLTIVGAGSVAAPAISAHYTAVTINGAVLDTVGMDQAGGPGFVVVAPGAFDVPQTLGGSFQAAPGGTLTYDVALADYGGTALTSFVTDTWLTDGELYLGALKTPTAPFVPSGTTAYTAAVNTSYARPSKNFPATVSLTLDGATVTAQGWDGADAAVNLDQPSPITGAATYQPVTLTHQAPIAVDIPGGSRPSHWLSANGAQGTVAENPTTTVFTVTNVAASFSRAFRSNWRNYLDQTKPDFATTRYAVTKHNWLGAGQTVYPEDVWGWNGHAYLHLNVTASQAATMTLVVAGIRLQVSDPHDTDTATRNANLVFTQHSESRTYTVALSAGTADYYIDLGFPQSATSATNAPYPMERPRVDSVTLSFSATGTFTVNACELAHKDGTYPNQIAIGYTDNLSRDYPTLYVRVDGEATPTLALQDDYAKGLEREVGYGGAPRFCEPFPLTGTFQRTVQQMWMDWDQQEGFAVAYAASPFNTFTKDSFGKGIADATGEFAQWTKETAPGAAFSAGSGNTTYQPLCCIRCRRLLLPNGSSFTARGRKILGAGVEAVVATTSGNRQAAGQSYSLLDDGGVTLATATTDSRGRIAAVTKAGKTVHWQ